MKDEALVARLMARSRRRAGGVAAVSRGGGGNLGDSTVQRGRGGLHGGVGAEGVKADDANAAREHSRHLPGVLRVKGLGLRV